jgi:spore maturation protein CgeB
MTIVPKPLYFPLFSRSRTNWRSAILTVEVIEAKSQVMLKTLHRTWLPVFIWRMTETVTVHTRWRIILQGWLWPVGAKFFFWQVAAPVPEIIFNETYIQYIFNEILELEFISTFLTGVLYVCVSWHWWLFSTFHWKPCLSFFMEYRKWGSQILRRW